MIIREPVTQNSETAGDLEPGTWFLDLDGQISAVLIDDRTYEKRVVTVGNPERPFIASRPARSFKIGKVLPIGTVLQIVQSGIFEGRSND
ncbi:MAG: hypothetical protein H6577_09905 [Lewinellaceae bacterium]|nr:hypothetical protein [Lewinellaceae bacterium]